MPLWLVTGATGFVGRHLVAALEHYAPPGVALVLLGRRPPRDQAPGTFVAANLDDPLCLEQVIGEWGPAVVFHVAGQTPPAAAEAYYRSNTLATIQLLDALRISGRRVRVVLAGSAAELGPVAAADLPLSEGYRCRPDGPYGLSKLLATAAGLAARPPLEVVVARIFNPIGPGLPTSQAFGRFAALLSEPGPDPLRLAVGPLDDRRDFIDVRDVARALIALGEAGEPGTLYHVGTGESHRVGDGLDQLIRLSGRSVVLDASPVAACGGVGSPDSRADITRIRAATGWRPEVSWARSLADLWAEARPDALGQQPRLSLTGSPPLL
jgi:GDP-4-dehydro-6-deoxy-D-mannose reductase